MLPSAVLVAMAASETATAAMAGLEGRLVQGEVGGGVVALRKGWGKAVCSIARCDGCRERVELRLRGRPRVGRLLGLCVVVIRVSCITLLALLYGIQRPSKLPVGALCSVHSGGKGVRAGGGAWLRCVDLSIPT